jgi:uncharacterized repeat protein (TIGR04138 family)
MNEMVATTLQDVARDTGRYPEEAFQFVREGLSYAVEQIHGPPTPALMTVSQFLVDNRLDHSDLADLYEQGRLDRRVVQAIHEAGGIEKLNRHVGGQELCWSLRDWALQRWGCLAVLALRSMNIRSTSDFGSIVFAMIKHEFMQREPHDTETDFADVYDFEEAMTKTYRIGEDIFEPTGS